MQLFCQNNRVWSYFEIFIIRNSLVQSEFNFDAPLHHRHMSPRLHRPRYAPRESCLASSPSPTSSSFNPHHCPPTPASASSVVGRASCSHWLRSPSPLDWCPSSRRPWSSPTTRALFPTLYALVAVASTTVGPHHLLAVPCSVCGPH